MLAILFWGITTHLWVCFNQMVNIFQFYRFNQFCFVVENILLLKHWNVFLSSSHYISQSTAMKCLRNSLKIMQPFSISFYITRTLSLYTPLCHDRPTLPIPLGGPSNGPSVSSLINWVMIAYIIQQYSATQCLPGDDTNRELSPSNCISKSAGLWVWTQVNEEWLGVKSPPDDGGPLNHQSHRLVRVPAQSGTLLHALQPKK